MFSLTKTLGYVVYLMFVHDSVMLTKCLKIRILGDYSRFILVPVEGFGGPLDQFFMFKN